jgi:DNA-binding LacI/PurR family transcriptional regulator
MASGIAIEEPKTVAEQVADHLRDLIITQGLAQNTKLPSYRDLASELGAHVQTVMRGMDILVEQGVVRRQRAQGCFVNRELSRQGRPLKTLGLIHQASHGYLFSTHYLQEIMRGIGGGPSGQFDINLFTIRDDGFVTAAQLADRHVDGVILLGVEDDVFLAEFATWGIPAVVADHVAAGIPLDFVACDNEAGVREAIARLTQQGHRHIRYFGSHPDQRVVIGHTGRLASIVPSDSIERRAAVAREAANMPGFRCDEVLFPWFPYEELHKTADFRAAQIDRWRAEADRPTALLTESDEIATDLLAELGKRGIRVPDEVSVCAVAGSGVRSDGVPRIAQSRFDFAGMGRKAVELLRWRCEHPAEALPPAVYRVGFEWVEGRTCGAREE